MAQSLGEMLSIRRKNKGLSIQQVANAIKMRPQIIEFFETDDYASMPPRGYAQGMIASYARFLGLNPREVVDAYFDGLYLYERSSNSQAAMPLTPAASAHSRSANDEARYQVVDSTAPRFVRKAPQAGYVPESLSAHEAQPVARHTLTHSPRTRREMAREGSADEHARARCDVTSRHTRERTSRSSQRTPQGGGAVAQILSDPRFVVACLAAIVVLLLLVVFLLFRSCSAGAANAGQGSSETSIPLTNLGSSTYTGSVQGSAAVSTEDTAPLETKVIVTYTGDSSAWLEVKVDGAYTDETGTVTKGFSKEYVPTQSIEINTDSPSDVEVTQNGERVRYDSKSSGIGRISITVPQETAAADTTTEDSTAAQ